MSTLAVLWGGQAVYMACKVLERMKDNQGRPIVLVRHDLDGRVEWVPAHLVRS